MGGLCRAHCWALPPESVSPCRSYAFQPWIVRGVYSLPEYCRVVWRGIPEAASGDGDPFGCGQRVAMTMLVIGAVGGYAGLMLKHCAKVGSAGEWARRDQCAVATSDINPSTES